MGLDMYLTKVTYIGGSYEFRNVTGRIEIRVAGVDVPIEINRLEDIRERVGYWRKANQIHRWFVENVQDGEDECLPYEVSLEQLLTLQSLCQQVLGDFELEVRKAIEDEENIYNMEVPMEVQERGANLLPSRSGFFFRSTDYDGWYVSDLVRTIDIVENLKQENEAEYKETYFEYCSSW
jgi:hypothetical protein